MMERGSVTLDELMAMRASILDIVGYRPNTLMVRPETRAAVIRLLKINGGFTARVGKRQVRLQMRRGRWHVKGIS